MASTSAAKQSLATKKVPNWVEMPDELMTNILQRLRTVDLLKGARKVCTTWRRICKDPAMWKVIVIDKSFDRVDECDTDQVLETLAKQAVDLSCGELIDINIKGFGSDELLDHIVLRSSKLKRLRLVRCSGVTSSGLSQAVIRLPQLEKLHLFHTPITADDIKFIGQNCPPLRSFKLAKRLRMSWCDIYAFAIATSMPELRHLKISDGGVTNDGLMAIFHGCPHLKSLDVRNCLGLYLSGKVGKMVRGRIKNFKYSFNSF